MDYEDLITASRMYQAIFTKYSELFGALQQQGQELGLVWNGWKGSESLCFLGHMLTLSLSYDATNSLGKLSLYEHQDEKKKLISYVFLDNLGNVYFADNRRNGLAYTEVRDLRRIMLHFFGSFAERHEEAIAEVAQAQAKDPFEL